MKLAWAIGAGLALAGPVLADDEDGISQSGVDVSADTGFIGQEKIKLEIDDCKQLDPSVGVDTLRAQASEHYQRGETLYLQGDYEGTVTELVAAYCLVPSYRMLKSIGQAYERSLEYEKAIAYLERWLQSVPGDAKKSGVCDVDPQDDKETVRRRIKVLAQLPSRVFVGTTPTGAQITISNETGVKARAQSGDQIQLLGGKYEMLVEKSGYRPLRQTIDVRIGKPYTFFVELPVETGTLSITASPPDAKIYVDNAYVGSGKYDNDVAGKDYTIVVEAPGRAPTTRKVTVAANRTTRELIELAPIPQTGRRQLIVASAIGGFVGGGALLGSVDEEAVVATSGLVLGAAGLIGSYFALPENLPLGTSNLTITSGVTGAGIGYLTAGFFSDSSDIRAPIAGAGLFLGATAGYVMGQKLDVSVGDAALINSTLLWGATTGALLTLSFDPPEDISFGLVLTGVGMGAIGGAMLARAYDIGRTHSLLIDLGGLAGIVGGLALQSLIFEESATERVANFALGGMAIGLVVSGVLTRNMDEPAKLRGSLTPSISNATDATGRATATFGLGGAF